MSSRKEPVKQGHVPSYELVPIMVRHLGLNIDCRQIEADRTDLFDILRALRTRRRQKVNRNRVRRKRYRGKTEKCHSRG
jgi:hypothetical protein